MEALSDSSFRMNALRAIILPCRRSSRPPHESIDFAALSDRSYGGEMGPRRHSDELDREQLSVPATGESDEDEE